MSSQEERMQALGKLFDSQMETIRLRLRSMNITPDQFLLEFKGKREFLFTKVIEMDISDDHLPFAPVIPRVYLGVYGLMSMIRNGDKAGYTEINPNEITDRVNAPEMPYFICDVENGRDTLEKSSENAEKIIGEHNRSCLVVDEGIALCVHTSVLSKHYLFCASSRDRRAGGVPIIVLCGTSRPKLDWYYTDYSKKGWGAPSCAWRI